MGDRQCRLKFSRRFHLSRRFIALGDRQRGVLGRNAVAGFVDEFFGLMFLAQELRN